MRPTTLAVPATPLTLSAHFILVATTAYLLMHQSIRLFVLPLIRDSHFDTEIGPSGAGMGCIHQPGEFEAGASSLYLAVSRAFGDPQLKKPSASSKTAGTVISAVPEVKPCALEADDLFFVVACDG